MGREIPDSRKPVIAAFDFDGTITKKDSLLWYIRHAVPMTSLLSGVIRMAPYLLLYKLRIIPNYQAKEKLFKIFFGGMTLRDFTQLAEDFCSKIDQMIRTEAIDKIKWHQQMGHEVIIISASAENWILPWAEKAGITTVLATKLEVKDGLITGKFLSKNCYGQEKSNRILLARPERDHYVLYAYGDSNGDKELLAMADFPFYRKFV
ncbi:HAD-IB family hydrolase [Pedobacter antarcticus]|uniref:HAD-IB family hydrolase n=1 Tax=Pedobacter antarcticus TaxID=34086 RepID=UPI001C57A3C9|nr:HAD-IB family hydrolase [Pedobacter antarcticus]